MAVIKILARHNPSYESLINYILRESKNDTPQVFTHNLRSTTPEGWTQEFLGNESNRKYPRKDQVFLYHEIISFSNLDTEKISPEILNDIAQKYMQLRGEMGLFLGAVHNDMEHTHIHFCTSGTKLYTGRAMRLSRNELKELKVSFQDHHLEKFPQIEKSTCEHGSNKPRKKNSKYQKQKRETLKLEVAEKVSLCLEKARTQQEFMMLLQQYNIPHYERTKGQLTGVEAGTKFRFTKLGIDIEKLKALPIDMTEEQKALKEIQALRQLRDEKSNTKQFNEIER